MSAMPTGWVRRNRCAACKALLAAVLFVAACVSAESWEASRILEDIEAGGGPSDLKSLTPAPSRTTVSYVIDGRTSLADLYEPNQTIGASLVLVPGFTPDGKDDPRLVDLATTLSRARFVVLVPGLAGSKRMQVRPEDARGIADAVVYLSDIDLPGVGEKVGIVAISYAVGLAVLASNDPQAKDRIDFLAGIGGYYDTTALVTYATTGSYRETRRAAWRHTEPNPAAKWLLLASNVDLLTDHNDRKLLTVLADRLARGSDAPVDDLVAQLGPEGLSLWQVMANDDPDMVEELLARSPEAVRGRLLDLSPANHDLSHLRDRLILIHGRADNLIPYTESLALGGAVAGSQVFLIDGFSHIDRSGLGPAGQLQLIEAVQAVLERRHP